jgi:hypothetical protein
MTSLMAWALSAHDLAGAARTTLDRRRYGCSLFDDLARTAGAALDKCRCSLFDDFARAARATLDLCSCSDRNDRFQLFQPRRSLFTGCGGLLHDLVLRLPRGFEYLVSGLDSGIMYLGSCSQSFGSV